MRMHQNTLLAMKLSTVLLSLIAVVLIVMLLTGSALAQRTTDAQKPQPVIQAPAQPTARSNTPVTSRVVIVYVVTATPSATAQMGQTVTAIRPAVKPPAAAAINDLPALPQLAAIPDVPNVPAPAPRSNSGGSGAGGGNSSARAAQSQPQPKPQPAVTTKTS
jgi:hypothetical protein